VPRRDRSIALNLQSNDEKNSLGAFCTAISSDTLAKRSKKGHRSGVAEEADRRQALRLALLTLNLVIGRRELAWRARPEANWRRRE